VYIPITERRRNKMERRKMSMVFTLMMVLVTSAAIGHAEPKGTVIVLTDTLGKEVWMPTRTTGNENALVSGLYDYLALRKPGSAEILPGLAEKWESSPDGKQWTFYLRRGIQFHDGWGEFTAEDVKFSIEKLMEKGAYGSRSGLLRQYVDRIEVIDPYKVIVRLKIPRHVFQYDFASIYPGIPMISKKYVTKVGDDEAARHPIGTGPYKFVEHKIGEYLKLEAMDKHWRVVPDFKTLIIKPVPEIATRIAMLRSGEADVISITYPFKKQMEDLGFKLVRNKDATVEAIYLGGNCLPTREGYNPKVPWVDGNDPKRALKVRKAMALAINKQAIWDHIFMGECKPLALTGGFREGEPWTDPAWKPWPYDPEEAKRLLAEAGYPNGFEVTMLLVPGSGREELVDIGEAVAMDWEKIGLKVKQVPTEMGAWLPSQRARKISGQTFAWGIRLFRTNSPFHMGFEDARMDELSQKAAAEPDRLKRAEYDKQLGKILYEEIRMIGIASKVQIFAVSKKVKDWEMTPMASFTHYLEYITRAD